MSLPFDHGAAITLYRRLWADGLDQSTQFCLIDTCLLAGTRAALARYACIDLLCRKSLLLGCRQKSHALRALTTTLTASAPLTTAAVHRHMEVYGFANEVRRLAKLAEVSMQANDTEAID